MGLNELESQASQSPFVVISNDPDEIRQELEGALNLMNRTAMTIHDALCIAAFVLERTSTDLPAGKKLKQQRGQVLKQAYERISLENGRIVFEGGTFSLEEIRSVYGDRAKELLKDSMLLGKGLDFLKTTSGSNSNIVALVQAPLKLKEDSPNIYIGRSIENVRRETRKKADAMLVLGDNFGLARALQEQGEAFDLLQKRRVLIGNGLRTGELKTCDRLSVHEIPRHPFIPKLKELLEPLVMERQKGALCDPLDLKYQTLFRLTTLPLEEVFEQGAALQGILASSGAYESWEALVAAEPQIRACAQTLSLKEDVVRGVIDEQFAIIQDRLSRSPLPLEQLLRRDGLFKNNGYVVCHGPEGKLFAAKESKDDVTSADKTYSLSFREVDIDFAKQVHADLHYIHTPRATIAYGLFVDGDPLPFSVLAFDKITRNYKEDALLANGFAPDRCLDLTRLYTCPGSPGNTSSFIFSLAFDHLRKHQPEFQAVLSAFMPSYASGVSMTSSGFSTPLLMKKSHHRFAKTQSKEHELWEHLTPRRGGDGESEHQWPLLPVLELMCKLQDPRFQPLPEAEGKMFRVNC